MQPTFTKISHINFEDLESFVNKRKNYLKDKENLISLYEGEKGINNDYKGRQLLELIQNADDAESSIVKIIVDTTNSKLQIVNEGIPFSLGGFQSLMVPHLSTKRKKKYIGNKGLGFRSILNWSKKVTITSGGCKVSFSPKFAKEKFEELYSFDDQKKLIEEYNYADGAIPFPVFAIPDISKAEGCQDQTIIEIDYYKVLETRKGLDSDDLEVEKAILDQISHLRKEVLLFLNWINTIHISIDGEITEYQCDKSNINNKLITIDNQIWKVFDNKVDGKDPILPVKYKSADVKEEESFSLKIAIQEGLKDDVNKLFSFFPTKIGMNFPMIIHGTFELDSSRNRIIDSEKNKFLIRELLNLIFEINDTFFDENANWNKLRLLNYKGNKDSILEEFGFYKAIDEKIKTKAILPCIDGIYRAYSAINFQSADFPQIVEEIRIAHQFPTLLQKIPDDLLPFIKSNFPNYITERRYTQNDLKSNAEVVAVLIGKTVPVNLYAKWIVTLSSHFNNRATSLSILFNRNKEIIPDTSTIFTPPTSKSFINVPNHIEIDYLSEDLFKCLIIEFGIHDDENKSRKLKDRLDSFINIQSFEPAPVLTKIVTNTTKLIGDNELFQSAQNELVLEMIRVLFEYYKLSNKAHDAQIKTNKIPILNQNGKIIFANESFLSDNYKTGRLRTSILGDIYESDLLIANTDELGLPKSDNIEDFLVDFLGVNKFVQIERLNETTKFDAQYPNFVFKLKSKPDRYRSARISASHIKNLNVINNKLTEKAITKEQFITWICLDSEIKDKLHSSSDTEFRYDLVNQNLNTFYYRLWEVPSYIRFQLSSLGIFNDYLLNDLSIPFLNEFEFNFKAHTQNTNHIDSTEIKEILKQLGAKTDFNNLSIDRVEKIIKGLPINDPHGKNARRIYLAAIDHFKENNTALKNISGLELHCTLEKKKQYLPYYQIAYVNNISLPRKVINETAVFNFPKRSGEKNVTAFFKVNALENINYTAGAYSVNTYSTNELNAYLKTIRPFILVHRLQKLKSDFDIKEAIRIVKSIQINLCCELTHYYREQETNADRYDFVVSNEDKYTYLVKYDPESNIATLKDDSVLSDIVSEIYSISFDSANIRDEIRDIFRNNIKDTHHKIVENFGEENLLNAISKLEITNTELSFWKTIYEIKGIAEKFPNLEDESDFRNRICSEFNINFKHASTIDYDNLDLLPNNSHIHSLFSQLNISLAVFNEKSFLKLNFFEHHLKQLHEFASKIKGDFIYFLWKQLSVENTENQTRFIELINSFDSIISNQVVVEKLKFDVHLNYEDLVYGIIYSNFNLSIRGSYNESDTYLLQYETNKKAIGINDDQINSLSKEDRSILYFKVDEAVLHSIKEKIYSPIGNSEPVEDLENKHTPSLEMFELEPSDNRGIIIKQRTKTKNHNGNGAYNPKKNDDNKILGKICEEKVLIALITKYSKENVIWLSGYSNHPEKWDGYGYDIKYRETKNSEWIFVEVKAFYNNYFYFTKTELEEATKYPGRYFLYLVNDSGIFIKLFKELLNECSELDYDNTYFQIEIEQYKFTKH